MSGEFLDDTHAAIVSFAEQFLEEDERESFIDGLMERHGYVRQSSWGAPEPPAGQQGGRAPLLKGKGGGGGQRQAQGQQQAPQQRQQGSYFKR